MGSIGHNSFHDMSFSSYNCWQVFVQFFCRFFAIYPLDELDRGLLDCSCHASIRCLETSSSHENQNVGKNTHVRKFGCLHAYFCSLHVLDNKCVLHRNGICIICCHAYTHSDRSSSKVQHNAEFKKADKIHTYQHDHSILSHLDNSYFKPHDARIRRLQADLRSVSEFSICSVLLWLFRTLH